MAFLLQSLRENTEPEHHSHSYLVRIIPPDRKSDAKTYEWHGVHDQFTSPTELRKKLMDSFKDKLPSSLDFQIGYLTKKGNGKRWIELSADLASMYKHHEFSDGITIFCDGKSKVPEKGRKRKRGADDPIFPAQAHEEEVMELASDLKDKYDEQWNIQQYKIWARMYVNNQWDSLDSPPQYSHFQRWFC